MARRHQPTEKLQVSATSVTPTDRLAYRLHERNDREIVLHCDRCETILLHDRILVPRTSTLRRDVRENQARAIVYQTDSANHTGTWRRIWKVVPSKCADFEKRRFIIEKQSYPISGCDTCF
jgi:hypothetical protein